MLGKAECPMNKDQIIGTLLYILSLSHPNGSPCEILCACAEAGRYGFSTAG